MLRLLWMTIDELFTNIVNLTRRWSAGEISEAEARGGAHDLLVKADLTRDQLFEVMQRALVCHHEAAKFLSERHYHSVPGNDPQRPN